MEPVTVISVARASDAKTYAFFAMLIGSDPKKPIWNCTKASSYKVTMVSQQPGGSTKDVRDEPVVSVVLQGNDPATQKRFTYCRPGTPGIVNLIVKFDGMTATDTVRVSLAGLPAGVSAQSDGKLSIPSAAPFTFSATPQAAPSEPLTSGGTRDVGQLSLKFSDSDLISDLPFNTYAKSTDLFSTDERDSKSSVAGTMGIQRGVFPTWYTPLHLEQTVQGNQVATNLSTLTALGATTLVPWSWSGRIFNNKVIQAPLPPDVTIDNEYTHRFRQIVTAKTKLLAVNDYALNVSASWSSISLPWACSLYNLRATNKLTYCLGLSADVGIYYLPLDTLHHEGYGDVSILLPLRVLSFASGIFPYLTKGDPAKSQIRVTYNDTVTAANNYAHTVSWTFGIEVTK